MGHLWIRLGVCFVTFGFCLYSYLHQQNMLTQVKMQLPRREKEMELVREEIRRLSYELDQYESPNRLIELAHLPEFSHLKHPVLKEILTVPEVLALNE